MRLWSLHPKYLDTKALVACWREGLLAKKVLENQTKGYRNHPQLIRFRAVEQPLKAMNAYLYTIYEESVRRGYRFDRTKIETPVLNAVKMDVTEGQLEYEFNHLMRKLAKRDRDRYIQFQETLKIEQNPLFFVVPGDVASWEIISPEPE